MSVLPLDFDRQVTNAVEKFWRVRDEQEKAAKKKSKKKKGRAKARRSKKAAAQTAGGATHGGKQMHGFCELVRSILDHNGLPSASIHHNKALEIPGFFRPTKKWDLVVVHDGQLLAAVEFKSQVGSFGKNLNNRAEEAVGSAKDFWTAFKKGAFSCLTRPWLGWMMLLQDCPASTKPVSVVEPHFSVFPEFQGTSYEGRYSLLCAKLVEEQLYTKTALVLSPMEDGIKGAYREPVTGYRMREFLASLGGHVAGYRAAVVG